MDTSELLKKVRRIEIKSRGLSSQIFSGEYHSAFKGSGIAFSEVREYIPGDDIRKIDWNVTARFNHPFIKVFDEERELTVMLLIDISASGNFGTKNQLKKEMLTEIAAVLAFSAIQNNDKIGAIFFSSEVEKFIPPKKGKSHILRIIREILEIKPVQKGTNLSVPLAYLTNVIKKKSTVFILSDFLDSPNYESALRIASRKHDLVALMHSDDTEKEIPDVGLISVCNQETGEKNWVDTSSKAFRTYYKAEALKHENETQTLFKKCGVDFAQLKTHQSYIVPLVNLFKRRESRR